MKADKNRLEEERSGLEEQQHSLTEKKDEEVNKALKEDEKRANAAWGKENYSNVNWKESTAHSHPSSKSTSGANEGASMD